MIPCHACDHSHKVMAQATALAQRDIDPPGCKVWVRRYFCHEDDHSCYNDYRGKYFEGMEKTK